MLADIMQILISPVIYSNPHIFEVHRDVFSHCFIADVVCGVCLLPSYLLCFYGGDLERWKYDGALLPFSRLFLNSQTFSLFDFYFLSKHLYAYVYVNSFLLHCIV